MFLLTENNKVKINAQHGDEEKRRRVISEVYQLVLKKDMQCHNHRTWFHKQDNDMYLKTDMK